VVAVRAVDVADLQVELPPVRAEPDAGRPPGGAQLERLRNDRVLDLRQRPGSNVRLVHDGDGLHGCAGRAGHRRDRQVVSIAKPASGLEMDVSLRGRGQGERCNTAHENRVCTSVYTPPANRPDCGQNRDTATGIRSQPLRSEIGLICL
jgi:hypothetical protein